MMGRFIAAMDHSGGSTGGVLERYGQLYTEDNKMTKVHAMRLRMVNSADFNNKNIWGAILYQDTVARGMVAVLKNKGVETFLKIDSGCNDNGTLKDFDVQQMCAYANANGCYGTKMRSIVKDEKDLDAILDQQFRFAEIISKSGLMPIIEPEVPIDHVQKRTVEHKLRDQLAERLDSFQGKCILKLTLPEQKDFYSNIMQHEAVHMIVGLSGGYSTEEACRRLAQNEGMSASFSRALSERLKYDLTPTSFNAIISENINMIVEAST